MNYCEWTKSDANYEGDNFVYEWGCGSGAICEAFMGDKCFYANFEYTLTDCYGNTEKDSITEYRYCCTTDNCNKMDIDVSQCEKSTGFTDMYKGYWECLTDATSPVYEYGCSDVDEITCDALNEMYKYQAGCWCKVYSLLSDEVSEDSQTVLQEEADSLMAQYSMYNDVLGCDIDLSCDISSDGAIVDESATTTTTTTTTTLAPETGGISGLVYCGALMWALLTMLYV